MSWINMIIWIVLFFSAGTMIGFAAEKLQKRSKNKMLSITSAASETVFNHFSEAIFVLDDKNQIVTVNAAASKLMMAPTAQLLGQSIGTQIPGLELLLQNGGVCEVTLAGKTFEAHLEPLTSTGQDKIGCLLRLTDVTDLRPVARSQWESENLYRQIIELLPDGIVIHVGGVIQFANPASLALLKAASPQDLIGRHVLDFIHPDFVQFARERLRQLSEEKRSTPPAEQRFRCLNGEWVDVEVTSCPLEQDEKAAILTVFHDIAGRKRLDEYIRQSEEKHRAFYETMSQGVVYVDRSGTIISANQAAERILGLSLEQLQGLAPIDPRWRVIHEDGSDHPFALEPAILSVRTAQPVRDAVMGFFNPQFDEIRWININVIPQFRPDSEQPYQAHATFEDITERRKIESELRESRTRLELQNMELRKLSIAIEQSGSTIVITDTNGVIQYANPRFEKTTGYSRAEAVGQNPRMLRSGAQNSEFYRNMWGTIRSGEIWRGEFHNRRKDGTLYWEQATIAPILNADGVITNFIAIKEDVTDRKLDEEKIKLLNIRLTHMAMTDDLTSLPNRRSFVLKGTDELKRARRHNQPFSLLMLDIDRFKNVNDSYGHDAGDLVLKQIAATLKHSVREIDTVARLGGEEFAILLPNTAIADALKLCARLLKAVRDEPCLIVGHTLSVTISIGAAELDDSINTIDELLKQADIAMYRAKNKGRNCAMQYQEE